MGNNDKKTSGSVFKEPKVFNGQIGSDVQAYIRDVESYIYLKGYEDSQTRMLAVVEG
jgi:hypothetical protein